VGYYYYGEGRSGKERGKKSSPGPETARSQPSVEEKVAQ
jgi:hypothetical protein